MFGRKQRCSCDTAKEAAANVQLNAAGQKLAGGPIGLTDYHIGEINELRRIVNALCDHLGVVVVHESGYKVYKQSDLGGPLFESGKSKRKK